MTERRPTDLGTTIAGIRFPFCTMNAAGAWSSTVSELRAALAEAGINVVVARNDFAGLENLRLEAGAGLELIAVGGIQSGYDVARALSKGARAVQVGAALVAEGPGIFARLAHEMRVARGERGE